MSSGQAVAIAWIPSHHGITGNEKVDSLAKKVTHHSNADIEIPNSQAEMIEMVKADCLELWNSSYVESETATHYKIYFPSIYRKRRPSRNVQEISISNLQDTNEDIAV